MAITPLKTNFKDDIIDTSISDKRRYNLINNPDGTVSLEDVTAYEQVGDNYGAEQINTENGTVNEIIESLENTQKEIKTDKGKNFVLINQQKLTFNGYVCNINDLKITENSLADVYFTSDTVNVAEDADISVETYGGYVSLVAGREPEGIIKATIVIRVV